MQLTLKLIPQSNYSLLINEIYTTLSQIHITLLDVKLGKLQQQANNKNELYNSFYPSGNVQFNKFL